MSYNVELFTMTPGRPFINGEDDYGIHPAEVTRIADVGERMTRALHKNGFFTVYSSGLLTAQETGHVLMASESLQETRQSEPISLDQLDDRTVPERQSAEEWNDYLHRLASYALDRTPRTYTPGLVVVTDAAVFYAQNQAKTRVDVDHLGLTRRTVILD